MEKIKKGLKFHQLKILNLENCLLLDLLLKGGNFSVGQFLSFVKRKVLIVSKIRTIPIPHKNGTWNLVLGFFFIKIIFWFGF